MKWPRRSRRAPRSESARTATTACRARPARTETSSAAPSCSSRAPTSRAATRSEFHPPPVLWAGNHRLTLRAQAFEFLKKTPVKCASALQDTLELLPRMRGDDLNIRCAGEPDVERRLLKRCLLNGFLRVCCGLSKMLSRTEYSLFADRTSILCFPPFVPTLVLVL